MNSYAYANLFESLVSALSWMAIIVCLVVGLLALLRPSLLATANSKSSRWIDSRKLFEFLDRQIYVDQIVLKHHKVFGVLSLLTAVGLIARNCYF